MLHSAANKIDSTKISLMKPALILSRFSRIAAFAAMTVTLCACGQRGALIHPDKDKGMVKVSKLSLIHI